MKKSKSMLVDMNNLVTRCIYAPHVMAEENLDDKYQIWRYTVFESILGVIRKFKPKEIVLGVDGKNCWRKDFYSIYKAHRKIKRDKDDFDWDRFFNEYASYMENLRLLPFNIIKVDRCEADDIIAILSFYKKETDNIIISMDKDYKQLLNQENCYLYNPIDKAYIKLEESAERFLISEILTGQKKDNVGNIITPLDWPEDKRNPPLGQKKVETILKEGVENWLENNYEAMKTKYGVDIKERFIQNKKILDLSLIPVEIKSEILGKYKDFSLPEPDSFYSFFKDQGWTNSLDNFTYIENLLLGLY